MKKSLWSPEDVEKFLEVAFSDFRYRSLGLLASYIYELGQRHGKLRKLEWKNVDLETSSVVTNGLSLPLSENLKIMTEQQKGDWDFQPYVFAYIRDDNAYRPLSEQSIVTQTRRIVEKAGLKKGLTIKELRDTSLVEMYKEGVSRYELMCLTGVRDGAALDTLFGVDPIAAYNAIKKRNTIKKLTLEKDGGQA